MVKQGKKHKKDITLIDLTDDNHPEGIVITELESSEDEKECTLLAFLGDPRTFGDESGDEENFDKEGNPLIIKIEPTEPSEVQTQPSPQAMPADAPTQDTEPSGSPKGKGRGKGKSSRRQQHTGSTAKQEPMKPRKTPTTEEDQDTPTWGDSEPSHTTAEPTDIFQDETIPIREDSGELSTSQNLSTKNRRSADYFQDPSPGTSSGNIIRRDPETRVDNLSRGVIIENFTRKNEGGWDAQVTAAEVTAELVELGLAVPPQTPGQLHASELTQESMIENSVARFRSMLQEGMRDIFASFPKQVEKGDNLEIDFSNVITPQGILMDSGLLGGLGRPPVTPLPPANKQETPDQPHVTSGYGVAPPISEVQVPDAPETPPLTYSGKA